MKRILVFLLALSVLCVSVSAVETLPEDAITIDAPSAILMEKTSGQILYEKNAYEHLPPASVTKVMTMLLIVEAIDSGVISPDDMVTASAYAAGMGGSQIWLEEGEQMSVSEMLKCIAVVSANDCCVAMAEHISGSEEAFVAKMNQRAEELGMADTSFTCCSGLSDSEDHYSCARDIAVMSRELVSHDMIKDYTTIWMDEVRNGEFGLSNTNKLIYYYSGATGLKTGFTSRAMYCLSATAERDGVEYIAVVLHAPSSSARFESCKTLLNYGFANYTLSPVCGMAAIPPVSVKLGVSDCVQPVLSDDSKVLVRKDESGLISYELNLPESITAPVEAGQIIGSAEMLIDGRVVQSVPLVAAQGCPKLSLIKIFTRLLCSMSGI